MAFEKSQQKLNTFEKSVAKEKARKQYITKIRRLRAFQKPLAPARHGNPQRILLLYIHNNK